MKNRLSFIILIFVLSMFVSCGFNVSLSPLTVNIVSNSVDSSALEGAVVGSVVVANNCKKVKFEIQSGQSDLFNIDSDGKITIKKNRPQRGTYNLSVLVSCDDNEKLVLPTINVAQFIPDIPTQHWGTQLGADSFAAESTLYDECFRSHVDLDGNVYCAGRTLGSLGETNAGSYDALIIKFDKNGNLLWRSQLGAISSLSLGVSAAGSERCLGVGVDTLGNVYCAGGVTGSLSEASGGDEDIMFLKLDSSGNFLWARQIGATTAATVGGSASGKDRCLSLYVDNANNLYCGGGTQSSLGDIHAGGDDIFVAKYSSEGDLQWFNQFGSSVVSSFGNENCGSITVDSSANVFCAGSTQSEISEVNAGGRDAVIFKLNPEGTVNWIKQLGSVSSTSLGVNATNNDLCLGISLDSNGNIYCAGETSGSLAETNAGGRDLMWMKLNSSGNILWLKQMGVTTSALLGVNASGDDSCSGLGVDYLDRLYCSGRTTGSFVDTSGGSNDIFFTSFNSNGDVRWVNQLGLSTALSIGADSAGDDLCIGVSVDLLGNSYCAGRTTGSLFGSNGGSNDVFAVKVSPEGDYL